MVMASLTITDIEAEILDGLPSDQGRLHCCRVNQEYYDLKNRDHLARRANESWNEYHNRPKRCLPLTYSGVQALSAHLYNPGPNRTWPDSEGDRLLRQVYSSNQMNALMQAADAQAVLNGVVAIGVHATGQLASPVRLDLYGADEIVVWAHHDDPLEPVAICSISHDAKSRVHEFSLWTESEHRLYRGRLDQRPERISQSENPYGVLPFAFVRDRKATRGFWEGGIGTYLREVNADIDRELSDLAQIGEFHIPIGILKRAAPGSRLIISPGYFNHLVGRGMNEEPQAEYLQAKFPALERMQAVESSIYLALESIGIPRSAIRLEPNRAMSGIAILTEQLPLLVRAKRRQTQFSEAENSLAKTILLCAGAYYGRLDWLRSATSGPLRLQWPEPVFPLPMPERDQADQWLLDHGLTSQVRLVMSRMGMTFDQAMEHLRQVSREQQLERITHES